MFVVLFSTLVLNNSAMCYFRYQGYKVFTISTGGNNMNSTMVFGFMVFHYVYL